MERIKTTLYTPERGSWVAQTDEEADCLLEFAARINTERAKVAAKNARAIEFMSRPE